MKPVLLLALLICHLAASAQDKRDSAEFSILDQAYTKGLGLITVKGSDTTLNRKSAQDFRQFENKIIRRIYVRQIGFDRSVYDSSARVNRKVAQIANSLHRTTREKIIRNHLFIKEGSPLNPYVLADNERYLRDRGYMMDARLVVVPATNTNDSVDVIVITRDIFSLGFRMGGSLSAPSFGVLDKNIDGRAQFIELSFLINGSREPWIGYSVKYGKSSVCGSLADAEIGYTQLNKGISYGNENEHAAYIRLNRPLVSPFSRFAGGLEISSNWSVNNFRVPDSTFQSYSYRILDVWAGYNLGIRRNHDLQLRYFVAVRNFYGGYRQSDHESDDQIGIPASSDIQAYLGELTIYRQEFYKTRFIYGFGRTEDIPLGFSVSVLGAYVNLYNQKRPYGGVKLAYSLSTKDGNFVFLDLKAGGYLRHPSFEDVVISSQIDFLTRAYNLGRSKLRGLITISNVQLLNDLFAVPISVNRTDLQRVSLSFPPALRKTALNMTAVLYTPLELLGIRFAPLAGASYVNVKCINCPGPRSIFDGIVLSAGFRARNENLVFGTVEVRAAYGYGSLNPDGKFSFSFRQNLRIKNNYRIVKPPMLISY